MILLTFMTTKNSILNFFFAKKKLRKKCLKEKQIALLFSLSLAVFHEEDRVNMFYILIYLVSGVFNKDAKTIQ